jgi:hypothetical protein
MHRSGQAWRLLRVFDSLEREVMSFTGERLVQYWHLQFEPKLLKESV